ncbi:hypothetical protein [Lacisediminihabitans profunda]|uniref:DUF4232 domain-containing protein n=1 Tax=Lacisediminihabitans profunda TaxID=2594790 RepID=A0A5C8UJB4_9MICO|nr:hypothetical protein [Lacisediminihabitans profunda]TXN28134.1 hypothetical protein FVP33_18505 [Lacisediminihabitans profunda]
MRRPSRESIRLLAGMLAVATAMALLSGCSTAPPPKLSVALFQNRTDYAPRLLEVEITNHGSGDVVITAATFVSPYFAGTGRAGHLPYTLVAGTTTDFSAQVPAAVCDAPNAKPSVSVTGRDAHGTEFRQTLTPTVPFDSLQTLHAQDCGQQAFERVATIVPAPHLRFEQRNGKEIALLDLVIAPTGASGSVRLLSTTGTTLLIPVEGELRMLDLIFTASSPPTTLTLDYVPSRCGTHFISEDKIGTLIPFHAQAGSFADAYFRVAVSPEVKSEFYDWIGRVCGQ